VCVVCAEAEERFDDLNTMKSNYVAESWDNNRGNAPAVFRSAEIL